ncbi:hypothetical protein AF70_00040190 [Pseudomonas sp. KD5]|nr:hypothetical protein [Pseudomonas sp. KD5]
MTAIQPAPDGPTRYRTPEESGMKTNRHTTQASTALLRHANGVDTQKTKSLCCAAAGITASISATAEALIPHEKLREAATPDATLIAQNCPPAQPVMGYNPPKGTLSQPHSRQLSGRHVNSLRVHRECCRTPKSINHARIGKQTRHNHTLFQCPPYNQEGFDHIWQWQIDRINAAHSEQLLLNRRHDFNPSSLVIRLNRVEILKQKATHRSSTLCDATNEPKYHVIFRPARLSSITRLLVSYDQCSNDGRQASDNLKPCRRIFLVKSQNRPPYNEQHTERGKQPQNKPLIREFSAVSIHCWLLAPKRSQSLPTFVDPVHGGQA